MKIIFGVIIFLLIISSSVIFQSANGLEYKDELHNYSINPTDFWVSEVYGNTAQDRYVMFYAAEQSGFIDFPPYFQIKKIGTDIRYSTSDFDAEPFVNNYLDELFDGLLVEGQKIDSQDVRFETFCPTDYCKTNVYTTMTLDDGGYLLTFNLESILWLTSSGDLFAITLFVGENDWSDTMYPFRISAETFTPFVTTNNEIPPWIKNNARWWAQGAIKDDDFVSGIQFLISQNIIKVPKTETGQENASNIIPNWIKQSAGWWAEGKVSDSDFINSLQFLIKEKIILIQAGEMITESTPNQDPNRQQVSNRAQEIWDNMIYVEANKGENFADLVYLRFYGIDEKSIYNLESLDAPQKWETWRDDTPKHNQAWDLFVKIIPEQYLEDITLFVIYTNGIEGDKAGLQRYEYDLTKWQIELDIVDAFHSGNLDEKDVTFSIIHELGHIITQDATQVKIDEELWIDNKYFFEDWELKHNQRAMECHPNLMIPDGCTKTNSYLNTFFQKFWSDIHPEFFEITLIEDDDEYYKKLDEFYIKYQNRFVTFYSSFNASEDIAESFSAFVLLDKPQGKSIAEQKILFFYDYAELVKIRNSIRGNL